MENYERKKINLLTFDIEEWFIEKTWFGGRQERYYEFDCLLDRLLEMLGEHKISATFFCLGKVAEEFPYVIRKIADAGHEIGCHSYQHQWINKMTPYEFREDTYAAISMLENVVGQKVVSFRAPAFSIGEGNKWAFEILAESGIQKDASIFPIVRDLGGFPNFLEHKPCVILYNGVKINEFPIQTYKLPIIGKEIVYSGGGYFRLLPLLFIKKQIAVNDYTMCYFHIADLLTQKIPLKSKKEYESYFKEKGTFTRRVVRYMKTNIGKKHALSNLEDLLAEYRFCSIREYLKVNKLSTNIEL